MLIRFYPFWPRICLQLKQEMPLCTALHNLASPRFRISFKSNTALQQRWLSVLDCAKQYADSDMQISLLKGKETEMRTCLQELEAALGDSESGEKSQQALNALEQSSFCQNVNLYVNAKASAESSAEREHFDDAVANVWGLLAQIAQILLLGFEDSWRIKQHSIQWQLNFNGVNLASGKVMIS